MWTPSPAPLSSRLEPILLNLSLHVAPSGVRPRDYISFVYFNFTTTSSPPVPGIALHRQKTGIPEAFLKCLSPG